MSKRKLLALVEQRLRRRLGRSAHADDRRHPAPRLHAGGDPRLLRAHRRRQEGERHRRRAARAHRARGPEPARAARAGGAAAAEGRHRELPGGARRGASRPINNPEDPSAGTRRVPFSRELYIERDDFMEVPPKKFFRLSPGAEVRLRYAYILKCERVVKDAAGAIVELRCTLRSRVAERRHRRRGASRGRSTGCRRAHARDAEVRLYDRLFPSRGSRRRRPRPADRSESRLAAERSPAARSSRRSRRRRPGRGIQFERQGYFCVDPDSTPGAPVFNRTVTLKDTWAQDRSRESRSVSRKRYGTES